jgi:hypothetical protein
MAPENGAIYHYTCPSMATTIAVFKCSILKAAAVYVTIDFCLSSHADMLNFCGRKTSILQTFNIFYGKVDITIITLILKPAKHSKRQQLVE